MAERPVDRRLTSLAEQMAELQRLMVLTRARKRRQDRQAEFRRKVLLGTMVLALMGEDESLRAIVERELPRFLGREGDRDLFDDLLTLGDAPETGAESVPDVTGEEIGGETDEETVEDEAVEAKPARPFWHSTAAE